MASKSIFGLFLVIFAALLLHCQAAPLVSERNHIETRNSLDSRPVFPLPIFFDDTNDYGLAGALLSTFLVEVLNNHSEIYPFKVDLAVHFAYSLSPEVFYMANELANCTHCSTRSPTSSPPNPNLSVIVGPESSSATQLVSVIGDVYDVPILSFWATSPFLSSKLEYPQIWRVVFSDATRIDAWVAFCKQMQWAHTIILNEGSLYSRGASESFSKQAYLNNIQVKTIDLQSENFDLMFDQIVESRIKIIMVPCTSYLKEIMENAVKRGMIGPKSGYVWILGDWGLLEKFPIEGSLLVSESNEAFVKQFNITENNQFLNKALDQVTYLYDSVNTSSIFRNGAKNRSSIPPVSTLWNANSLAVSLAKTILLCYQVVKEHYLEYATMPNATQFTAKLKSYQTREISLLNQPFQFDEHQDSIRKDLWLYNIRKDDYWHKYAKWDPEKGILDSNSFQWPDGTFNTPDDGIALETYPQTSGFLGVFTYIIVVVLSCLIIASSVIVFKYSETPVIRLASPWFLLIILAGLLIITCSTVLNIGRPTSLICTLRGALLFLGYTLALSALIAKTWRVFAIFRASQKLIQGYSITNIQLLRYTAFIATPAFLLIILRASLDTPYSRRKLSSDNSKVFVVCQSPTAAWNYASMTYALFLFLIALVMAFLTRSVPSGFNETKQIFISVYAVATLGVIGIGTSFAVSNSNPVLAAWFSLLPTLLCTAVLWTLLFVPKFYILFIRPEQNTLDLMRHVKVDQDLGQNQMQMQQSSRGSSRVPLMEDQ